MIALKVVNGMNADGSVGEVGGCSEGILGVLLVGHAAPAWSDYVNAMCAHLKLCVLFSIVHVAKVLYVL